MKICTEGMPSLSASGVRSSAVIGGEARARCRFPNLAERAAINWGGSRDFLLPMLENLGSKVLRRSGPESARAPFLLSLEQTEARL